MEVQGAGLVVVVVVLALPALVLRLRLRVLPGAAAPGVAVQVLPQALPVVPLLYSLASAQSRRRPVGASLSSR